MEEIVGEYCGRLQAMGREIQQIEQLNRGLNVQTANQQRLLLELDSLIGRLSLPEEDLLVLEQAVFTDLDQLEAIEAAAVKLHAKTGIRFEDGMGGMVAVRERMEFFAGVQCRLVERLASFFVSTFTQHVSHTCILNHRFIRHLEGQECWWQEQQAGRFEIAGHG